MPLVIVLYPHHAVTICFLSILDHHGGLSYGFLAFLSLGLPLLTLFLCPPPVNPSLPLFYPAVLFFNGLIVMSFIPRRVRLLQSLLLMFLEAISRRFEGPLR